MDDTSLIAAVGLQAASLQSNIQLALVKQLNQDQQQALQVLDSAAGATTDTRGNLVNLVA